MVIMALDHVRDFMHTTAMTQSPTDLQTTTTLLFMTRWITHLCAPTFVFLSGVSAYISFKKHNDISASGSFLFKRGLWLILLDFTFINFALWFDIHFRLLLMEVISAIGLSFIVLSFMLKLKSRTIGITGLSIILLHNLLQYVTIPQNPVLIAVSSILFRPALLPLTPGLSVYTAYPLVPWLGIMLAGFACGEFFMIEIAKRNRLFLRIGFLLLAMFTVIRFLNIYGDPAQWTNQKSVLFTFLSFINVTKYPPSLQFTLLFTGISFLVLYITEKAGNKVTGILSVYGKVPLFYFVIHLFLIHGLMLVMLFLQGFRTDDLLFGAFNNGRPKTGGGVDLLTVYIIWLGVVALLYPVCKWYGKYKSEHSENRLLRYL
jgi:uncharacterized membrane protein